MNTRRVAGWGDPDLRVLALWDGVLHLLEYA